jgi:hypothetical protein
MKKVSMRVFKVCLIALYLNFIILSVSVYSQSLDSSDNDKKFIDTQQIADENQFEGNGNVFIQTNERFVANKYHNKPYQQNQTVSLAKFPNRKLKTNKFVIIRRKLPTYKSAVINNNFTDNSNNITSNDHRIQPIIEKKVFSNLVLTNNILQSNNTANIKTKPIISEVKNPNFKLAGSSNTNTSTLVFENNYTNLTSFTVNQTNLKVNESHLNLEKTNFSQLTTEFFVNFYNQVKGNECKIVVKIRFKNRK